ncbi:hypothetical protein O3P69_000439 [Scylla paramamosain]|uniref:Uncharacterized protein n=1 Tax=Scylla paramamosain TaxID=85552 RepID=A0AAW0UT48_SCYPA
MRTRPGASEVVSGMEMNSVALNTGRSSGLEGGGVGGEGRAMRRECENVPWLCVLINHTSKGRSVECWREEKVRDQLACQGLTTTTAAAVKDKMMIEVRNLSAQSLSAGLES